MKLMKLDGYQTWLSWSYQAKELMAGISNEQAKVALIYESLIVQEDKQHLKGLSSLSECNRYLIQKYNRPFEIISSILAKGTQMQVPGDSNKISKANCLTMIEIRRDLKKYNSEAKIDSFFISNVAGKCFTDTEYGRYVPESDRDDELFEEETKKALVLQKTKLVSSTAVPGDIDKDLALAAKARALSDEDDDSDAEPDLFSFVAHSKIKGPSAKEDFSSSLLRV